MFWLAGRFQFLSIFLASHLVLHLSEQKPFSLDNKLYEHPNYMEQDI